MSKKISKILHFVCCFLLLISCKEERIVLKDYTDNHIELQWYYEEFFYQRGNDFIEISCQPKNTYSSTTTLNFPEDWINKIDVKNQRILIDHTITSDIIKKVMVKDSICGYEVVLNKVG